MHKLNLLKRTASFSLPLGLFLLAAGCGGSDSAAEPEAMPGTAQVAESDPDTDSLLARTGQGEVEATTPATFTNVKSKVFVSCGGPIGCHLRGPFGGGLDLSSANAYSSLVGVEAKLAPGQLRVRPYAANVSFLYQKLTNTLTASQGSPMPKSEGGMWTSLSKTKLSLVSRWIDAGALNN